MGPLFGSKKELNGAKRPNLDGRSSKETSPNRATKTKSVCMLYPNLFNSSTLCSSNSSLMSSSPRQAKPNSSSSNLYFLVIAVLLSIFGILLSIGALVFNAHLQSRVENLEQQLSRYEVLVDNLQRKLLFKPSDKMPDLTQSAHASSSFLVSGDLSSLIKNTMDIQNDDSSKSTASRVRPSQVDPNHQEQFDQIIHDVCVVQMLLLSYFPKSSPSKSLRLFSMHICPLLGFSL